MDMLLAQYALQPDKWLALDAGERSSWSRLNGARRHHRIRLVRPHLAMRPATAAPAPCC